MTEGPFYKVRRDGEEWSVLFRANDGTYPAFIGGLSSEREASAFVALLFANVSKSIAGKSPQEQLAEALGAAKTGVKS